ncbi:glycosyltransferase [Brevifollis gellanilyticus]|uniref:Glycosyl transferase family 1 domain-containing protein n=1 Tax=Brevifollis gellanilyticus TaxID=748831 RepID=A0A512MHG2_9BACT|nr:glycosyltransferase [Brevifollis gellanilyticus]GEP46175.1 hypothetical protein BGE01nite_54660 [Brevifollis gellanilyticus]
MKNPLSISVVGNLAGRYGISVAAQKHAQLLQPLCSQVQVCDGPHARHGVVYHHAAPPPVPPPWYNGKRVIGYWVVESSAAAPPFKATADALAQIWTSSAASARAIRALGSETPVFVIPHPVPVPSRVPDRSGRETVTTLIAFAPGWERKNPEGSIRAWQQAFLGDDRARLIIKMRLAGPAVLDCVKLLAGDDSRVEIISTDLPDLGPLYERADIFLSLHHAGAFEMHVAEAAAWGLPIVTTAVGGVLDYLRDAEQAWDAALLIPGESIPSRMEDPLNRAGQWLEPDEAAAITALRRLAESAELRRTLGSAARGQVQALLHPERITALMAAALGELPAAPKTAAARKILTLLPPSMQPLRSGLEQVGETRRTPGPMPVVMSHRRSGTHLLGEVISRHWDTPWLKTHHFPDLLPQMHPPVYVLRNPVDCLHSTWRWWLDEGVNPDIAQLMRGITFADWLAGKAGKVLGFLSHRTRPTDSLEVGRGSMHDPLQYWLHHWQEARRAGIPVILYEDLVRPEAADHVTSVLAEVMQRDPATSVEVIQEPVGFSPSPQHQLGKALKAWPKPALKRLKSLLTPDLLHSIQRESLEDWLTAK